MNFAVPPLSLPATRRLTAEPQTSAPAQPEPERAQPAAAPEETSSPVAATYRDLTIPDILPAQRASWRRPRHIQRRAS